MEPASLLTTSLTSRRFHAIASSPQVWRLAFANYFPPPPERSVSPGVSSIGIDKRSFTRVSACPEDRNPWRHEFIHRVKLVKAYTKGRLPSPKHNQKYAQSNGALMQSYKLLPWHHDVSHMAANFRAHPNSFRVIHASLDSQTFSASNPVAGMLKLSSSPRVRSDRAQGNRYFRVALSWQVPTTGCGTSSRNILSP